MEQIKQPTLNKRPLGAFGIAIVVAVKASIFIFAPLEFMKGDNLVWVRIGAFAVVAIAIYLARLAWIRDAKAKMVMIILFVSIGIELLIIGILGEEPPNQGMLVGGVFWLAFIGWIAWSSIDKQLKEIDIKEKQDEAR
jgi:hypothetical protein